MRPSRRWTEERAPRHRRRHTLRQGEVWELSTGATQRWRAGMQAWMDQNDVHRCESTLILTQNCFHCRRVPFSLPCSTCRESLPVFPPQTTKTTLRVFCAQKCCGTRRRGCASACVVPHAPNDPSRTYHTRGLSMRAAKPTLARSSRCAGTTERRRPSTACGCVTTAPPRGTRAAGRS